MIRRYPYFFLFLFFHLQSQAQVTVNVSVDIANPGHRINEDFIGLSMEQKTLTTGLGCCGVTGTPLSYFDGIAGVGNSRLIKLFHNLSPHSILRMGGATVDRMRWIDTNRGASDDSLNVIYRNDADKLFNFLQQVGWKTIYTVNFGTSYADGIGNPANAAAEAAYVYNKYPSLIHSISIGNEPYNYGFDGYRDSTYNSTAYIPEYRNYYDAIKAGNPAIPISGGDLSHRPGQRVWIEDYINVFNNQPGNTRPLASLNVHAYTLSDNNNRDQNEAWLLSRLMDYTMPGNFNSPLVVNLPFLVQSANNAMAPLRYSETGSSASDNPKISNKFVTAIWALDFSYTLAKNKIPGMNFHGGGGSPYSVLFWGGSNNNPATNPQAGTYPVNPLYYGLLAFADGAHNKRLLPVTPVSPTPFMSSPRASYFATLSDDGKTAKVTVINKDTLLTIDAVITLPGQTVSAASSRMLKSTSSPYDMVANTFYAGTQVAADGSFTPVVNNSLTVTNNNRFTVQVPPIAAAVITVNLVTAPLPVHYLSFTGKVVQDKVALQWSTSSETNNRGFEVLRSTDGVNFTKTGWVAGRNNTTQVANYTFNDFDIAPNAVYYYRLKQLDADGRATLSTIVQVKIVGGNGEFYTVRPNPSSGIFTLYTSNANIKSFKMYNSIGKEIPFKINNTGGNAISFSIPKASAGVYYLNAYATTGKLLKTISIVIEK